MPAGVEEKTFRPLRNFGSGLWAQEAMELYEIFGAAKG